MHPQAKKQLLTSLAPAAVPICRAAVNHHYNSKRIQNEREHQMEIIERQAELQKQQQQQVSEEGMPPAAHAPAAPASRTEDFNVYDELDEIRHESESDFCRSAARELLGADRETAHIGLRELREYEEKREELRHRRVDQETMQQEMRQMIGRWDVVPDVVGRSP